MRTLIIILALLALSIAINEATTTRNDRIFYNCKEARQRGYLNITKDSKLYRKSLDRDGDGVACETKKEEIK